MIHSTVIDVKTTNFDGKMSLQNDLETRTYALLARSRGHLGSNTTLVGIFLNQIMNPSRVIPLPNVNNHLLFFPSIKATQKYY